MIQFLLTIKRRIAYWWYLSTTESEIDEEYL